MSRAKHNHWLLGMSTSVLKEGFIVASTKTNFNISDWFPFVGKPKLPTRMEVLKLWYYLRVEVGKKNGWVGASVLNTVVGGVVEKYWLHAGSCWKTKSTLHREVDKLVKEYQILLKSKGCNDPVKNAKKIEARDQFLNGLYSLFDVAHPDLENILSQNRLLGNLGVREQDLKFLQDQRGPRLGFMAEEDVQYGQKVAAQVKRSASALVSKTVTIPSTPSACGEDDDGNNEIPAAADGDSDDRDPDYNFNIGSRKPKKPKTMLLEVPCSPMTSTSLTQGLDRTRTSDREAMRIIAKQYKGMKTSDGAAVDLNDVTLSYSTIRRHRIKNREVICKEARDHFLANMPPRVVLHWDGKMLKDITGRVHEMEAILLSGYPVFEEGKLIGVIELVDEEGKMSGTGETQCNACITQVRDWGAAGNIVALCFDTTSSNTGRIRGAAIRLHSELGVPLLYLGCRHHIFELTAKRPYYALFNADPAPEAQMFKNFRDHWSGVDTSAEYKTIVLPDPQMQEELIKWYQDLLVKESQDQELLLRGDYRQVVELAIVLLGGELPEGMEFHWVPPGAAHKARFLAYGIMGFKIYAFSDQQVVKDHCFSTKIVKKNTKGVKNKKEDKLVFHADQVEKLRRFNVYSLIFYVPNFITGLIKSIYFSFRFYCEIFLQLLADQMLPSTICKSSRDSSCSRQWMKFWLRQLWRRWGTTTGTCAARWCSLPSSPTWSPTRRSRRWPRSSSASTSPQPSSLESPSFQRRSG